MGQSKLRARQYGGRRIIAPAIYQDADMEDPDRVAHVAVITVC